MPFLKGWGRVKRQVFEPFEPGRSKTGRRPGTHRQGSEETTDCCCVVPSLVGAKTHAVTQQRCTHESIRRVGLADELVEAAHRALIGA